MSEKSKNIFAVAAGVIVFVRASIGYEQYVDKWSEDQAGAIMRLDVFIAYPIILSLSVGMYYLFKKFAK